jgi:hypothetical protein
MGDSANSCPICRASQHGTGRYTNVVCNNCLRTHGTLTDTGIQIEFGNTSIGGGFASYIDGVPSIPQTNYCYVNGIKCCAYEARFGGIVIQACREQPPVAVPPAEQPPVTVPPAVNVIESDHGDSTGDYDGVAVAYSTTSGSTGGVDNSDSSDESSDEED